MKLVQPRYNPKYKITTQPQIQKLTISLIFSQLFKT